MATEGWRGRNGWEPSYGVVRRQKTRFLTKEGQVDDYKEKVELCVWSAIDSRSEISNQTSQFVGLRVSIPAWKTYYIMGERAWYWRVACWSRGCERDKKCPADWAEWRPSVSVTVARAIMQQWLQYVTGHTEWRIQGESLLQFNDDAIEPQFDCSFALELSHLKTVQVVIGFFRLSQVQYLRRNYISSRSQSHRGRVTQQLCHDSWTPLRSLRRYDPRSLPSRFQRSLFNYHNGQWLFLVVALSGSQSC